MSIFIRKDAPQFWWLYLEPRHARDKGTKERTTIRADAPDPLQRKENKALALRLYHDRMAQRAAGLIEKQKPTITLRALVAWFELHKLPHRRGKEREAQILPRLVAALGDRDVTTITPAVVTQHWITPRLSFHKTVNGRTFKAGPSTVNREVDTLKAVLNAAVPEYFDRSPLYGMKRLKTQTPKRRLLEEDEEKRLLAALAPDDRALFLIGLDGLVRMGDILDLRWSDYRGETLWIADPKAGGGFALPLSKRARQALKAVERRGPYMFPRRRVAETERDRRSAIRSMLRIACAAADPPVPYGRAAGGITFHWATRRTGATRMLTRNIDPGTVQKVGRWKTPAIVLGIYHELIDDQARAAVESVKPRRRRRAG